MRDGSSPVLPCQPDQVPDYQPRTFDVGRHPGTSDRALSLRMGRVERRDNGPELAVRRLLHAAGLRYRVVWPVPGQRRRTIDIAFTRLRLAVFVDGCFWHGCPQHLHLPRTKRGVVGAQDRDQPRTGRGRHSAAALTRWHVLRFWEHEDPVAVCASVQAWVGAPPDRTGDYPTTAS